VPGLEDVVRGGHADRLGVVVLGHAAGADAVRVQALEDRIVGEVRRDAIVVMGVDGGLPLVEDGTKDLGADRLFAISAGTDSSPVLGVVRTKRIRAVAVSARRSGPGHPLSATATPSQPSSAAAVRRLSCAGIG
jgi:hypothetical protein